MGDISKLNVGGTLYDIKDAKARTDVSDLREELSLLDDTISVHVKTENIYDESSAIDGKYVDNSNGVIYDSASYTLFPYMDCSNYQTLILSRSIGSLTGINIRYAFYNSSKSYISGGTGGGLTVNYDGDLLRYYAEIAVPTGAKYIQLSYNKTEVITNRRMCLGGTVIYVPFVDKHIPKGTEKTPILESTVIKPTQAVATSQSMVANDSLTVYENNISTANEICFYAKITAFSRIDIGHFNISDTGIRLAIGTSKITYFVNGTSNGQVNHGLTIKDYIFIRIAVNNKTNDYKITIITNGGKYERTDQYWSGWYGSPTVTVGASTSLSDCRLVFNVDTLNSNYWLFGDSYLGKPSTRWVYYLFADNINNVLINSYPGAGAQNIYPSFANLVQRSTPNYALWLIGMNNADSTELNASWQVYTENFIIDCINNGITPILATIPNTPTQNNMKKNAYVRKCGLKYIDFASAVGANESGSTWFDGMLSSDQTHPTEYGAQALYLKVLADFPEILNAKYINSF